MTLWLAALLGLIQGLTEFIPVSSSGHLAILQIFLAGTSDHHFLTLINFGTLLALLLFFRREIFEIFRRLWPKQRVGSRTTSWPLVLNLLLTSIPAGLVGFLLGDFIETSSFMNSLPVIAAALAIVGLLMVFINRLAPKPTAPTNQSTATFDRLTPQKALVIGLAQICSLHPGVSRSGSTILAGRFVGLPNEQAARYSFLASIPLMGGVCLYSLVSSSSRAYIADNWAALLLGNLIAFLAGFVIIKYLLRYLKRPNSLRVFGLYRLGLAAVCLAVYFWQVIG